MSTTIAWINRIDDAGVILSTDSEALGVGALRTPQVADVWRSALWSGTINLRVDLGGVRDVRVIALAAPRDGLLPAASATVQVTASAVQVDDVEALDTGALPLALAPHGLMAITLPAAIPTRWLRLQCVGAGDPYLQLGRLWIGDALVTQRNLAYGAPRQVTEHGASGRAGVSGVRYAARGARLRSIQMTLNALPDADAVALDRCGLEAGTEGQVLLAWAGTGPRTAMLGRFSRPPAVRQVHHGLHAAELSIEEDA